MDEKCVIVFIDSFPYSCVSRTKIFSIWKGNIAKVQPGFGYSINVKAEIFGGYSPDALGYLNEWSYDPSTITTLHRYRRFTPLFRFLKRFYYLDRIAHKLVSKLYGHNIHNIPFDYLSFFKKTGTEPYRDEFHLSTIFSEMKRLKKIGYYHFPYSARRDYHIYVESMKAISKDTYDNIFVAFGDLDGITHSYGVESEKHNRKIEELDNYLCRMYSEFQNRNHNGQFYIISDHGMANVNKSVDINMEEEFGRVGEDTYIYFIDSTMLRVWIFNAKKKEEIETYFNGLDFGRIVDRDDRIRYRITSKKFGDIIFLLNEGAVFNPGFFGRKMPKAMHGYWPELESQKGLIFSNQILNKTEYATTELFTLLKETLVSSAT